MVSLFWVHSPVCLLPLQGHLSWDSVTLSQPLTRLRIGIGDSVSCSAQAWSLSALKLLLKLWTRHCLLLRPEQAFYHPVSCQSQADVLTSDSLNPLEALQPVAAHLFQHQLVPTPLAWLEEESALLFIVIHMEDGEQRSQTQCRPVSALTHASSISRLQRQRPLLFSHAGWNDFTSELQRLILPHSVSFCGFVSFLSSCLPLLVASCDISSCTQKKVVSAGFTTWITHFRQTGCMLRLSQPSNDTTTGERDVMKLEELIWVSKHLIKKLPWWEALRAARGASRAELLSSISGN